MSLEQSAFATLQHSPKRRKQCAFASERMVCDAFHETMPLGSIRCCWTWSVSAPSEGHYAGLTELHVAQNGNLKLRLQNEAIF